MKEAIARTLDQFSIPLEKLLGQPLWITAKDKS